MASNLNRSGFRGTRFVSSTVVWVTATTGLFYGVIDADQWLNLSIFTLGLYGASEVGTKGATAYAVQKKESNNGP